MKASHKATGVNISFVEVATQVTVKSVEEE
jgi:hypothetical protein